MHIKVKGIRCLFLPLKKSIAKSIIIKKILPLLPFSCFSVFFFIVQIFSMILLDSLHNLCLASTVQSNLYHQILSLSVLLKISYENVCYAPFRRMKKLKKCKPPRKMLPLSAAADVAQSLVITEVLLFSAGALLPSAFEVGSTCDVLSYKSHVVTTIPRNELHHIM